MQQTPDVVVSASPAAGTDYPRDWDEFTLWFPDDDACRDYLDWLRWGEGFLCPKCGSDRGWKLTDARWSCGGCKRRISPTAGTIFDRTKTPLTTWFAAAWYLTNQKQGVSALGLKNVTGVSYQTAWSMLHKYRSAMVRPGRGKLRGVVEVDESYIGGVKPGKRGRGAHGKALVGVAVELDGPRGLGRARLQVLKSFEAVNVLQFVRDNVEEGASVVTDGAKAYESLEAFGYTHRGINVKQSGHKAHELLPGVHRVAGQALVARHAPGRGRTGPSAELPQRVLFPLQPPTVPPTRHAVLPTSGAVGGDQRGDLRAHPEEPADA